MTEPPREPPAELWPSPAPTPPADDAERRPAWRRAATAALGAATGGARAGVPF